MLLDTIRTPADLRDLGEVELAQLAAEIRDRIVQVVARNSGHLGSNLGVVELTLALHRVFDSPTDRILWDTGHLAYVHKLLTGRNDDFESIRQDGGLSGYPSRAIPSRTGAISATFAPPSTKRKSAQNPVRIHPPQVFDFFAGAI